MRYLIVALVCALLALPSCKTTTGATQGAVDDGAAPGAVDKVEHIELKVEGLKKKKEETEKRIKSLEQEVKKPDPPPPPTAP